MAAGDIHSFSTAEEAETYRKEKGGMHLDVTRDEVLARLCSSQDPRPPSVYWIVRITKIMDRSSYMSETMFLPPYDPETVFRSAADWSIGKGFVIGKDDVHKFSTNDEAEKFRAANPSQPMDLNVEVLNKYLCANQPEEKSMPANTRKTTPRR